MIVGKLDLEMVWEVGFISSSLSSVPDFLSIVGSSTIVFTSVSLLFSSRLNCVEISSAK